MSKELEARIVQLEILTVSLLDEIIELKAEAAKEWEAPDMTQQENILKSQQALNQQAKLQAMGGLAQGNAQMNARLVASQQGATKLQSPPSSGLANAIDRANADAALLADINIRAIPLK